MFSLFCLCDAFLFSLSLSCSLYFVSASLSCSLFCLSDSLFHTACLTVPAFFVIKVPMSRLTKCFSGLTEKRIVSVGIIKVLTEGSSLLNANYVSYWPRLLNSLIRFFEESQDDSVPDDEHFIEIENTPGYQSAFCQLVFASKSNSDPFRGVVTDNPKMFLAQSLQKLGTRHPGKIMPMIQNGGVEAQAVQHLQQYLLAANIQTLN